MSALPTLTELQEARVGWRYLHLSDHPNFVPVDPDRVRHVQKALADGKIPSSVIPTDVQLAAVGSYLPPQKEIAPLALGYVQGVPIGSLVIPEFTSLKRKAAIPSFGAEKFAVNDKPIGTGGSVDDVDTSISWLETAIEAYGGKTYVDDDERDEAAGNLPPGISVEGVKLDRLVTSYDTLKEKHQATFARNTANYATSPSNFFDTLAATTQWTHADSTPVTDWARARRKIQKYGLTDVDLGWLSGDAATALRMNPQILAAVKWTGEKPGNMVPIDFLVALFGMNLAVASMVASAYPGETPSELWGQDAGMVATGRGQVLGRRFAATATHAKYPYESVERDGDRGGRGSDRIRHSDAWGLKSLATNAGYLFINAAEAY
ncbi:MAG: hypothetical protein Q8P41_31535 [Pseudomonadota bacterium]|nr:hypothetical protein [Pseudomonadota bacterium]